MAKPKKKFKCMTCKTVRPRAGKCKNCGRFCKAV